MESKNNRHRPAPCLAVFGTGSDVGKSVVTTALCRWFANKGIRVAPYKAQNMSNNSGVTPEGLEMGRAQIVQAEAAGIPPHVDMNPILLKPTSDVGAQVVLLGEAITDRTAAEYHRDKERLFSAASAALDRLRMEYDLIIMEGAGSCAEVNLMSHDIVNFKMAEYADAPILLVADIHRGGVFAQLIGTLACLPADRQKRIAGFVINRFRGDLALFEDGIRWIEKKSAKPVYGVLPWFSHFRIEAEDSVVIEEPERDQPFNPSSHAIAVIRIPHISNFTDFDPLKNVAGLDLHFVESPRDLSRFNAVILPGSKNTRFDLNWLHSSGWAGCLMDYMIGGGHLLGICGGYQMMGRQVHDPDGLEGKPGSTPGLDLLPVETVLQAPKTTTLTQFHWNGQNGTGYEIHMGRTRRFNGQPLFHVTAQNGQPMDTEDGCITPEGRVMGTYIHGLFDSPGITGQWLDRIGLSELDISAIHGPAARDADYNQLAEHFARYIDVSGINRLVAG